MNSILVDYRTAMRNAEITHDWESQSNVQRNYQRYGYNLFFWNDLSSIYDALQYDDVLMLLNEHEK